MSVTDRCDFRCVYCMSEHMTFLPKKDLLTLEELDRLCSRFRRQGRAQAADHRRRAAGAQEHHVAVPRAVAPPRSGGARRADADHQRQPARRSSRHELKAAGVRRINVSLDTLEPDRFTAITRWGDLDQVMAGIDAADKAPASRSRSTRWRCKGVNEDEIDDLIAWRARPRLRPDADRDHAAWARSTATARISTCRCRSCAPACMRPLDARGHPDYRTGGPARYVRVEETGGRLGFITPMTHNFCESCNRVRLTCTGTLYMCLGQDDAADLRAPLRASADDALAGARHRRGHLPQAQGPRFRHRPPPKQPAVARHMSVTGG